MKRVDPTLDELTLSLSVLKQNMTQLTAEDAVLFDQITKVKTKFLIEKAKISEKNFQNGF